TIARVEGKLIQVCNRTIELGQGRTGPVAFAVEIVERELHLGSARIFLACACEKIVVLARQSELGRTRVRGEPGNVLLPRAAVPIQSVQVAARCSEHREVLVARGGKNGFAGGDGGKCEAFALQPLPRLRGVAVISGDFVGAVWIRAKNCELIAP